MKRTGPQLKSLTKQTSGRMIPFLENPVAHLLTRLEAGQSRWLVGLAGPPGSGKSTLAVRLAQEVNAVAGPETMLALGMDGFHLTKAALRQMPDPEAAFARRGAPWTFDVKALAARLHALRFAGETPVEWPDFQHELGDPVEGAQHVPPTTRLILVEGLYLLYRDDDWAEVNEAFDERLYLDTPLDLSLERLVERHMKVWNIDRVTAQARVAGNDKFNALLVQESRVAADWRLTLETGEGAINQECSR